MSRTTRRPNMSLWGQTKAEAWADYQDAIERWGPDDPATQGEYRDWAMCGTDSRNWKYHNHWYFNQAHRKGRRTARDQLRPHFIMNEDWDFDPSEYDAKWRGVWWDIY